MKTKTFDQLPEEVHLIQVQLNELKLLLLNSSDSKCSSTRAPLTISEAAHFLRLAVPTLYSLVGRKEIPFSKKGKRLYFNEGELVSWIEQGRRKTISEIQKEADNFLSAERRIRK